MTSRRIVMICYPGIELLDVAGPINVLTAADRMLGDGRGYRVELAASAPGPLETAGGIEIVARLPLSRLRNTPSIDTLLVPGGLFPAMAKARSIPPALKRLAPRSRRIVAVCSGTFLLAEAGLLRGRRVVTHWAACDELRRRHPDCRVEEDAIFVRDGRVWTSAGVTAGIDLALALVEEDHGASLALEIARWLVMYLRRPGGQRQFSAPLAAQRTDFDPIAQVATWIGENLRADISTSALARRASMSVRNFSRVFRREIGTTPKAFVAQLRLEAARRTLELTLRSSKEIAHATGFGNVESMHRAFQQTLGITPLQYRQRFARNARRRIKVT